MSVFIWERAALLFLLGGVIAWHRAVACLVSVSNCFIYILPFLLLIYKYDDNGVSWCDTLHFYVLIFVLALNTPVAVDARMLQDE